MQNSILRELFKASQAKASSAAVDTKTQALSPGLANEVAKATGAASSLESAGGGGMSSEDVAELLHARRAAKKTQAEFGDLKGMSSVVDIADTIEVNGLLCLQWLEFNGLLSLISMDASNAWHCAFATLCISCYIHLAACILIVSAVASLLCVTECPQYLLYVPPLRLPNASSCMPLLVLPGGLIYHCQYCDG